MESAPSPNKAPSAERWLVAILFGVNFTHLLDFVIMMPLGPQLMRIYQITPQQFSLVVSAYTFSASISGFITALLIDRWGRKRALLVMYAGFIVGTASCAVAPTYHFLLLARIVAGAFGGVVVGLIFAIVADAIPMERRGRATGSVMSAFSIASIAGIPLGLWLATHFTWHVPFASIAFVGCLVFAGAAKFLPPLRDHLERGTPVVPMWENLRQILVDRNHIRAYIFTVALAFAAFTIIPFISPYLVSNVGFAEGDLPLMYFFGGVATFFSSRLIGALSDRHGKYVIFIWVATLSLIPVIGLTNLPPLRHAVVYTVTTFFMILVSGRFVPAMAILSSASTSALRGGFMSVNSSIQQMAAGVGAIVAGAMIQEGAGGQLLYYNRVGALSAITTIVSLWLARKIVSR